ncbi:MAG: phosphatidate cytidylyltransferase [Bdellovibrio sp.]|nr:MAG: phosphatidate cytidylyltransferase [Bdellovibrio sp.]
MNGGAWSTIVYQQTVAWVLGLLFFSGLVVYFLRQRSYYFVVSWASIKSWLFVAPILLALFGLPEPFPLLIIVGLAILGTKVFFQLMGMFHRSYFVLLSYAGILCLGLAIHGNRIDLYNLLPMIMLGTICLVPLLRNNYKRMIQYLSLTNLAFVFLGWSFMHLGLIMKFPKGIYQVMYLVILTEFCDNTNLAISRYVGRVTLFDRIDTKRSLESTLIAAALTLALAFLMRYLLPDESEVYWLTSGLVASFGGLLGDLVMTVIRRDAGIRVMGPFILGRGDYLHRMDRLIFVAPIYYYVMLYLTGASS